MQGTTELNVTKGPNPVFRSRVNLLVVSEAPRSARQGTYLVRKYEAVLQDPRFFQYRLDSRIVSGAVDFRSGFAQSNQSIFDLHVRVWAIYHGCMLQQLCEEQWVLADSLDWLPG